MNHNYKVMESLKQGQIVKTARRNQSFIIKTLLNSNLQKRLMASKTAVQIIIQIILHGIKRVYLVLTKLQCYNEGIRRSFNSENKLIISLKVTTNYANS